MGSRWRHDDSDNSLSAVGLIQSPYQRLQEQKWTEENVKNERTDREEEEEEEKEKEEQEEEEEDKTLIKEL